MPKKHRIYIDHHIAQLEGVDSKLLNSRAKLLKTTLQVARDLHLTVVNSFIHKFKPHGVSLVLIICESHLAVHTWPEYEYLHLDIVSCSPDTNLSKLAEILKKEFVPKKISCKKILY